MCEKHGDLIEDKDFVGKCCIPQYILYWIHILDIKFEFTIPFPKTRFVLQDRNNNWACATLIPSIYMYLAHQSKWLKWVLVISLPLSSVMIPFRCSSSNICVCWYCLSSNMASKASDWLQVENLWKSSLEPLDAMKRILKKGSLVVHFQICLLTLFFHKWQLHCYTVKHLWWATTSTDH